MLYVELMRRRHLQQTRAYLTTARWPKASLTNALLARPNAWITTNPAGPTYAIEHGAGPPG
jgi:hypothetical protein